MKFPRTYHLPWSPGATGDDKVFSQEGVLELLNIPLVITEKLDGENQCWTSDSWHLRSENSTSGGVLRSKSKSKWAEVRHLIPAHEFWFIEDISNTHSIEYSDHLYDFFVIAIWNQRDGLFESYDFISDRVARIAVDGLTVVPFIEKVAFSTLNCFKIYTDTEANKSSVLGGEREGLVCVADGPLLGWSSYSAKWVRPNHVKTDSHWTRNCLRRFV